MTAPGPYTRMAVGNAGVVRPDRRGLMPLAQARRWLRRRNAFERGSSRLINGVFVLDSDITWAALLSLADAKEFMRVARRLRWKFDPRGMENVAPVERYGEAVLPWLAEHVSPTGVLTDRPWCISPCLLALGTPAAFDVVWRVKSPAWLAKTLLRDWLKAHARVGRARLAALAKAGDPRARRMVAARKAAAKKKAPARSAGAPGASAGGPG